MGNKYGIDFKLQVVGKYERGKCGYKKLAREFNLSRDTVRSWCLDPKLHNAKEVAKKGKTDDGEKDLDYYKTAAFFWEEYAKAIEEELAKQGKKKVFLKIMKKCLKKNPKIKVRKLCKITGVSKSTFYYNRNNRQKKENDEETLSLLKKLPSKILSKRGSKAKSKEILKRFGKIVNHKKIARICQENGLLAKNRRRKFPKNYYVQQKENKKICQKIF